MLKQFRELWETHLAIDYIIKYTIKDKGEQPDEEIHKEEFGRVLSAGASVLVELGSIALPEQRGVYQPGRFPNAPPWGIFVETSSHEKVKVLITQSYPILCKPFKL